MTDINDSPVKRRVLIDWDGDGFMNEGVSSDTPENLFPAQLYITGSELDVYLSPNYDTTWPFATNTQDFYDPEFIENRGFTFRRAILGNSFGTERIRILLKQYRDHQPRPTDLTNLIVGTNFFDMGQYGYSSDTDANNYAPPAIVTVSEDQDKSMDYDDFSGITLWDILEEPMSDYCGRIWRGGGEFRYILGQNVNNGGLLQHDYYQLGFIDIGTNNYTSSVNAALPGTINWDGFPVSPNTTYRFSMMVNVPRRFLTNTTNKTQIAVRLYADGNATTGTPNFGRTLLAKSDPVIKTGGWQRLSYTFTTGATASQMAVDISSILLNCSGILIGGMILTQTSAAHPARIWDSAVTFNDSQFAYTFPGDNLPYNLSFWTRANAADVDSIIVTRKEAVLGTNTITSTLVGTFPLTDSFFPDFPFDRIDLAIPASTSRRGVWFEIEGRKAGSPIAGGAAAEIDFTGFMLTQGSATNYPYHAGTLYGYEDVTPYTLQIETSSGKENFLDGIPKDGEATLTMNNDDKRFSPSGGGFLAPYLKPNLKVKIQVYDTTNAEWSDVWVGWTSKFEVVPGTSSTKRAVIECRQGIERLAEGTLHVPVQETIRMDELARNVIEASGWRSAGTQAQSFVGTHTLVGQNAYVMDQEQLYTRVDEGIVTIEITGTDWSQKTDPRKALEDALDVENAVMWINRNGSLNIINRDYWIAEQVQEDFILDTEVNAAEYEYGQNIINAVEVTLRKPKAIENSPVWKTNRPVKVNPRQVWVIDLNPTFDEGRTKTVIEYTLDGMTKNVYTKAAGIRGAAPPSATQAQKDKIIVELLGEPGERPQLRITNKNTVALFVEVEIKGDYLDVSNGEIIKMEDEDSINELQTRHLETYSPTLLSNEDQAESYGAFVMLRQSKVRGEFTSFRITVRNQADLDRILALKIGSIVNLTEAQSGENLLAHAIIGEDFSFTDGKTVSVTYKAARTLQEEYAKTDVTTTLDATVNIIPADMLINAKSTNGGVFGVESWFTEGLDEIMYWQTGQSFSNRLVLAPSRDQLVVLSPLTNLISNIDTTDFAGNVSNAEDLPAFGGRWGLMLQPLGLPFVTGVNDLKNVISFGATPSGQSYIFHTQMTVGAGFIHSVTFPALAGAKYWAWAEYFLGDTALTWNSAPEASFFSVLNANKGKGGAVTASRWQDDSTATLSSLLGVTPYQAQRSAQFRARANAVGTQHNAIGFQVYGRLSQTTIQTEAILSVTVLRYSDYAKVSGVHLDTTISHKYTLFVRTDYDSLPVDWTMTVIAEDGSTIGTTSHTIPTTGVTKFEVNIPSGNKSAWAYLSKNTDDFKDTKLYIYGYGITTSSVSTYTDLLVENTQEKVYA